MAARDTLAAGSVHDVNSFANPETVKPVTVDLPVSGWPLVREFPAASVTRLEIGLI